MAHSTQISLLFKDFYQLKMFGHSVFLFSALKREKKILFHFSGQTDSSSPGSDWRKTDILLEIVFVFFEQKKLVYFLSEYCKDEHLQNQKYFDFTLRNKTARVNIECLF